MQFRQCLRGVHTPTMQVQEFRIVSALKGIAGEDAPQTRDLFHQK
jgi:hypothetical protein